MLNVRPILTAYPTIGRPLDVRDLGAAGGFSGARFWRVETEAGAWCLRRWPAEYPTAEDLRFIHAVLRHVAANGFELAATPLENSAGMTHVPASGHLWELSPWLPGRADFCDRPTERRLAAAMASLASFHKAAEAFCPRGLGAHRSACPGEGPSPGIRKRVEILRNWLTGRAAELEKVLQRGTGWPEVGRRAERLLRLLPRYAPGVAADLAQFDSRPVPLQPCIRDVWHDHVLFEGDEVTGLIDFGSMGVDNVACDVARLLGDLAVHSPDFWRIAVEAYAAIRPLSDVERRLVGVFDRSGVLLGALNWTSWLLLEGRFFEEPEVVLKRMDALMDRLDWEGTEFYSDTGLIY